MTIGATKRSQTLTSGIMIRQDFRDAVRFVMFQTGYVGWEYATHGGTAFVVSYRGKPYAITCRHVQKDFDWSQLVITDEKLGKQFARLQMMHHADAPYDAAVDADILDVAVIEFNKGLPTGFFKNGIYIISTSAHGNQLYVAGALKERSRIDEAIHPGFCLLEFQDDGIADHDSTLRRAIAQFEKPEFENITGLSGAPVYDATANKLCGMATRAGRDGDRWLLHYVDIFDITKLLELAHSGENMTTYKKTFKKVTRRPVHPAMAKR